MQRYLTRAMGQNGSIGSFIGKRVISLQIRGDAISAGSGTLGAFNWGKFFGWDNYATLQAAEESGDLVGLYINIMAAL